VLAALAGVIARPRPRFELTDLEWQETGVFDVEVGAIRSPGPGRFLIADFELDFGILFGFEPKLRLFEAPARVMEGQ
jgi:hypothetical protein